MINFIEDFKRNTELMFFERSFLTKEIMFKMSIIKNKNSNPYFNEIDHRRIINELSNRIKNIYPYLICFGAEIKNINIDSFNEIQNNFVRLNLSLVFTCKFLQTKK